MSHVTGSAILSELPAVLHAVFEVLWRAPVRIVLAASAIIGRYLGLYDVPEGQGDRTSIWLAFATSVFAPFLAYNWHLLLARPRAGLDRRDGLLVPAEDDDDERLAAVGETELERLKDEKHGFHGFLYSSRHSLAYGTTTLKGSDAVWLHAHGGGFYAGEARQYHHTYKRWVEFAHREFNIDLRIVAVEYPLSTVKPYPGCIEAISSAYKYVLKSGVDASQVIIAGDSAGGNGALSACYRIIEHSPQLPSPAGLIMLSPWLDLTRQTSGHSPNQPTDWLTTFDSDACKLEGIEVYMGETIKSASDIRVSPLFREPDPRLPRQFLSAGTAEVLYADSVEWAKKVKETLGQGAIECHFAKGQVHTFAIGGWLADTGVEELSDWRLLSFVHRQTQTRK